MAKRPALKALLKRVASCKAKIAAERDKLNAVREDIVEILDCCEDAEDSLRAAVDTLSQYL